MKKILSFSLVLLTLFLITDLLANILNLRPTNSTYGWLHSHQTYKNVQKKINFNEYGTRDESKQIKKKNIILLGDSTVETSHSAEKMPARLIENELGQEYNVYSFGSWGWGSDQQLLMLKKSIKKINPEYVILLFSYNDFNDNYYNIGFNGEKPTFKLINNKLQYPKLYNVKKFLNYSWYYRSSYRIYLKFYHKLITNKKNKILPSIKCDTNKKYLSQKEIFNSVYDWDYEYSMHLYTTDVKNQMSKEEYIHSAKFFLKENNYGNEIDKLNLFRETKNTMKLYQQKLTSALIQEIKKISENNESKFILYYDLVGHEMFEKENIYSICINNHEVNYSNKFLIDYLDKTFKNIDNLIVNKIERGEIYYDNFDGHKNTDTNKKMAKKIVDKIKEISIK